MEINKKAFLAVLSQIKAHKDVIVFKDSQVEGCLDILYGPNWSEGLPRCVNRMTIRLDVSGSNLFDDAPVEKLGGAIPVFLGRVKNALRNAQSCILKDGCVNGIRVEVNDSDVEYLTFTYLINIYEQYSEKVKFITDFESVSLRKIDYAYLVSECAKFVSDDPTRYFMYGMCFDFGGGGKDFIHVVATDGQKLCIFKQAASHKEYPVDSESGRFIVPPAYLHIPSSDFTSAAIRLNNSLGQVLISTEEYHFEGLFECIEGKFPNYSRVIPKITEKSQWFTLCAASFRRVIESVKSLMGRNGIIYLNADNPERFYITFEDSQQTLEVEGMASRPMRLSFMWKNLSACLFDVPVLTKFMLDSSNSAFLARETKAVKGLTLDATKLFMPTQDIRDGSGNYKECDEFRIPVVKEELEKKSAEFSLPSFVHEPEPEPELEIESDSEDSYLEDEPF